MDSMGGGVSVFVCACVCVHVTPRMQMIDVFRHFLYQIRHLLFSNERTSLVAHDNP